MIYSYLFGCSICKGKYKIKLLDFFNKNFGVKDESTIFALPKKRNCFHY